MLVIHFDILGLQNKIKSLQVQTQADGFWNDVKNSSLVLTELKQCENKLKKYSTINDSLQNLLDLNELLLLEEDDDLIRDLLKSTSALQKKLDLLEIETLFSGKYDKSNAILTLHPGARGY